VNEVYLCGLRIEIAEGAVGRPRRFHEDVGFAICCAAELIETGLDRQTVRTFMAGMTEVTFSDGKKLLMMRFIAQMDKSFALSLDKTHH
jgi:hypothetical protein